MSCSFLQQKIQIAIKSWKKHLHSWIHRIFQSISWQKFHQNFRIEEKVNILKQIKKGSFLEEKLFKSLISRVTSFFWCLKATGKQCVLFQKFVWLLLCCDFNFQVKDFSLSPKAVPSTLIEYTGKIVALESSPILLSISSRLISW